MSCQIEIKANSNFTDQLVPVSGRVVLGQGQESRTRSSDGR